jgi:surfactin synthase thioesterase subunit
MIKHSLEGVKSYFPGSRIHRIGPTPLLMHVPKRDVACSTDAMLEAYNRAVQPKEIQMLPGGHFSMFVGDEFEKIVAREIDFLKRTLLE